MKIHILYSILLFHVTSCLNSTPHGVPKESYRFLITGQSNAVSPAQGDISSYYSKSGKVTINDYYGNSTEFFIPNVSRPVKGGVVWLCLGDLLFKPTYFNVIARGGTSTKQWRESYYQRILEELGRAEYDAVLWVQGESDASLRFSTDETLDNMAFIISQSRMVQDIPWYVAIDGMNYEPTRRAQELLIQYKLAKRGPDMDVLRNTKPQNWDAGKGEIEKLDGHMDHAKAWYQVLKSDFNLE